MKGKRKREKGREVRTRDWLFSRHAMSRVCILEKNLLLGGYGIVTA